MRKYLIILICLFLCSCSNNSSSESKSSVNDISSIAESSSEITVTEVRIHKTGGVAGVNETYIIHNNKLEIKDKYETEDKVYNLLANDFQYFMEYDYKSINPPVSEDRIMDAFHYANTITYSDGTKYTVDAYIADINNKIQSIRTDDDYAI